jgi:3-methylfumaryl-CoA hydratase
MSNDTDPALRLTDWIGREVTVTDVLRPAWANALAASLDCREAALQEGDALHPGWHWIFFHSMAPLCGLGDDGHNRLGDFLPPLPSARRMWAGGRLEMATPLRLGEPAERRSAILDVRERLGKSGKLFFVTVRHNIACRGGGTMIEDHDIAYRVASMTQSKTPATLAQPAAIPDSCRDSAWSDRVTPSAIQLFRYSALTFNSHRIHYDAEYARTHDGYPGVVVHGPLIATFLLELLRRQIPRRLLRRYTYRAVSPAFLGEELSLFGRPDGDLIRLWATGTDDRLVMRSEAEVS